jgi:G-rich domain on putative tyrosine kinase
MSHQDALLSHVSVQPPQITTPSAATVDVIDPARLPTKPVEPNTSLVLALSILFGLSTGIAGTFAAESLDNLIQSPEEVETLTGVPLFGMCSEFFRVLKPGGRLVAVREHVISGKKDLPAFLSCHPLHRLYGGENAFLLTTYRNAMLQAGFTINCVLSPLSSVINYAPYTEETLKNVIADRVGGPLAMRGALRRALRPARPVVCGHQGLLLG